MFGNRETRLRGCKRLKYLIYDLLPLGDVMWQARTALIAELRRDVKYGGMQETTPSTLICLFDRLCEEAGNPHPRPEYLGADVELAGELGISRERVRQLRKILLAHNSVQRLKVLLMKHIRDNPAKRTRWLRDAYGIRRMTKKEYARVCASSKS